MPSRSPSRENEEYVHNFPTSVSRISADCVRISGFLTVGEKRL